MILRLANNFTWGAKGPYHCQLGTARLSIVHIFPLINTECQALGTDTP
jgi:hypothetical protein